VIRGVRVGITVDAVAWIRALRQRLGTDLTWTAPTSTEVGVVVKSGVAAGLAWFVASAITSVSDPVLAPLTALVVVQVSVRASVRTALQRSVAVAGGVLLAVAIGDALELSAVVVAVLVTGSLAVAQLVVRLPAAAARQVPISMLVVLAALAAHDQTSSWRRVVDTLLGAVVGASVTLVLPASRVKDARQTLARLGEALGAGLDAMSEGLRAPWSADQTTAWRIEARTTRERLVAQAVEAIGNSREAATWNVRDRRHVDELARYEEVLPRFERTAIGVSVISRGLDDHARLVDTARAPMRALSALLAASAHLVRAVLDDVLGRAAAPGGIDDALAAVHAERAACVRAAQRRAETVAAEEWLSYAAILVQIDRIVVDLSAPLPPGAPAVREPT
jgi:uncharacterized membrane protein YgaE (UPF0421/DUF939 family)